MNDIYIFGIVVLVILIISFGITIYEFIEMDKHPDAYKNPRYKNKKNTK